MSRVPQIKIGADYFRTTVRKESAYPLCWRWVKETLQNSYDAGATEYTLYLNAIEHTAVAVDNGCGMDEDTLLDVFLSFGGSKKEVIRNEDGEAIGGFGDAKKVVCFCWDRWEIKTQDNFLSNELLGKKIQKCDKIDGTIIKVWMDEEFNVDDMIKYINLCQLQGIRIKVLLTDENGEKEIETHKLLRRKLTRDLEFAKLYVNKSMPDGILVVRLKGLALYTEDLWDIKATCILELENAVDPKSKEYMLNVTREQLMPKYRYVVSELIREILSEPQKALKPRPEEKITIIQGSGAVLSIRNESSEPVAETEMVLDVDSFINTQMSRLKNSDIELLNDYKGKQVKIKVPDSKKDYIQNYLSTVDAEEFVSLIQSAEFEISNNDESYSMLNVPSFIRISNGNEANNELEKVYPYDIIIKGSTKLRYDGIKYQKLLLAWHKMIQYVIFYNCLNDEEIDLGYYKIGFIFDDDVDAQYAVIDGTPCYLLNPTDLNFQVYTWKGVVLELLDRATHEIAHNYIRDHNGDFIGLWNKLKKKCHWYMNEIFNDVGGILRSRKEDLVYNSKLNETFNFEEWS
jgi:hypothetical protein